MSYARWLGKLQTRCRIRSCLLRQCLAEFLGVFLLIPWSGRSEIRNRVSRHPERQRQPSRFCVSSANLGIWHIVVSLQVITLSAAAQSVTSGGTKGNYLSSSLASGVAVMVAVHLSGGVSGGHLNPAFSLSLCLLAQFPWWKLPVYCLIQVLGAFTGAGTVYILYYDAIHSYSNGTLRVTGPRETASIFATYPAPYLSVPNGFFDQVLGTGVLVLGILAMIDARNKRIPPGLDPLAVGLLVFALSVAMGANSGCAINPARDLGPRLFTYVAGWGPQVFSAGDCWWWVPIAAPMLGATVGTVIYQFGIEFHHPDDPTERESSVPEKLDLGGEKETELPVYVVNTYAESWKGASPESQGEPPK